MQSNGRNPSRRRASSSDSMERETRQRLRRLSVCSHASRSAERPGRNASPLAATQVSRRLSGSRNSNERVSSRCRGSPSPRRLRAAMTKRAEQPAKSKDALLLQELCTLLRTRASGPSISRMADHFATATLEPPITKDTLKELNIDNIVKNLKLRHDINFDRSLHFRPNLDCPKGQRKKQLLEGYWSAIAVELELYNILRQGPPLDGVSVATVSKASQKRLPAMFAAIKDVLKDLVPEHDQATIEEHFDVQMIMQEIEKGVCDFVRISEWLAQLIKQHCAPMRDEMADRMTSKIGQGDVISIAKGCSELFGILEAMKLDVANHQIRHLRPLLIHETINFEQRHFSRIDPPRARFAREWFLRHRDQAVLNTNSQSRNVDFMAFVLGMVRLVNITLHRVATPYTFSLDMDRLATFTFEIIQLIRHRICYEVFEALVFEIGGPYLPISAQSKSSVRNSIRLILADVTRNDSSTLPIGNMAVELVRHALRVSGSESSYDAERVEQAEEWLLENLSDQDCMVTWAWEVECELTAEIFAAAEKRLTTSPWDVFNALVAPPLHGGSSIMPPPPPPPVLKASSYTAPLLAAPSSAPPSFAPPASALPPVPEDFPPPSYDLTTRMAHVAVLHWRVWAPLVYMNEEISTGSSVGHHHPEAKPGPKAVQRQATIVQPPALLGTAAPHHAPQDRSMSMSSSVTEHEADTCGPGARV